MPTLIKLEDTYEEVTDAYLTVEDDQPIPAEGGVILSFGRFQAEGVALFDERRAVGVWLEPDQPVEALAYDLPRLAVVALNFPKYRDGRAYSTAALLRERLRYRGEVRAVGDVLREQAREMVRCGFDAFVPADGSTADDWWQAAGRYRHVYQRAADWLEPAFVEREEGDLVENPDLLGDEG